MADDVTSYESLGADINKSHADQSVNDTKSGVVSAKLSELTLAMKDIEIAKLTKRWEKTWIDSNVRTEWEKKGEENEKYWLGLHFDKPRGDSTRADVDNGIFEALETWLPKVTRRNPEPLVTLAKTELDDMGNADTVKTKYVTKVKGRLGDLADTNKIRLKLKRAGRHWAIYLLGAVKHGWDLDNDCPTSRVIRPKKLILDPEAWNDEDGYTGEYVGERRKLKSSKILAIIGDSEGSANAKKVIDELTAKNDGTDIQFIEWWTKEYMCWTLKDDVLLKRKNPHWNYDRTENPEPTDMASEGVQVDTYGNTTAQPVEVKGINHFSTPRLPYNFLVVFSLGDQPVDKTSLIGQNLSNQDRINKRNRQIDKNADNMNEGLVVSLERAGLTESQAKQVSAALRKGGVVAIPSGNPQEAVYRPTVNGLPADIYNDLTDKRNRLMDIFGTRGSSPAGIGNEKTVRGKYMVNDLDTDRIGGGVSEYFEQFADDIFNWWVQLLYVYDTGFQFVGGGRPPKIVVSVKEGSLLPQDTTTLANQAVDLATAGKMSTLDLYKALEKPNAEEMAANVWLETNAPEVLYSKDPRVQQVIASQQAAMAQAAQADAAAKAGEADAAHRNAKDLESHKSDEKVSADILKTLALPPIPNTSRGGG